ncbi:HTH-type transcriptional regulator LeuO [Symmachiella macrocystis]|uniref:HTH-type transcriptional regulator LeuO n=2 Tax=Symmachiella macrocystis TaxID=2527985 RepID=A0A5C6ASQ9_9PLAN|nr:HTH-type transcriptional regulator LeuO [Symmachiella macrocystis]
MLTTRINSLILIEYMSNIDHLNLDGNTLTTFLTVLEETSVSRAAERLGVTQSAVSHTLDKLRVIFDDPLFIRVGRGIESTARARALQGSVESVLGDLKSLTDHREFDPLVEQMEFTIAANDFPIHFIFPNLLKELSEDGIHPRIRFIPSGIPSVSVLRASRYRMLITPTPPNDPELKKESLIRSKMEIFFDASVRKPPRTRKQFSESRYVEVRFSDTEASLMALPGFDVSRMNPPMISVPNFGLLAPMIKGTDRITTQIAAMKMGLLKELDTSPLPFKTDPLDLFLIWHRREHDDPAHRWLRQRIIETVTSLTEG